MATPEESKKIATLEYFHSTTGNVMISTVAVKIKIDKQLLQDSSTGENHIDATIKAINRVLKIQGCLENFVIASNGIATCKLEIKFNNDEQIFYGEGKHSSDIMLATANAYIDVVNQFLNSNY